MSEQRMTNSDIGNWHVVEVVRCTGSVVVFENRSDSHDYCIGY